jgi:hypothetical protein
MRLIISLDPNYLRDGIAPKYSCIGAGTRAILAEELIAFRLRNVVLLHSHAGDFFPLSPNSVDAPCTSLFALILCRS